MVLRGLHRVGQLTTPWADRAYLGSQYKTDANLSARQSIYGYQHPLIDLATRVLDLAAPAAGDTVVDAGCGNGMYLPELARRAAPGRVIGVDLSLGMLATARGRLASPAAPAPRPGAAAGTPPAPAAPATRAPRDTPAPRTAPAPRDTPAAPATAAPRDTPAAVALAGADVTALPLRDGAADLALAAHMLYHVPEPAAALRELRRVTRPGGRVVIVLNGRGHLAQLRAAVAAARGTDPATMGERVTLDTGESLARSVFSQVTRHDFVAELHVPAPGPIVDYFRSWAGTAQDAHPEAGAVLTALPRTPEGHYLITTHSGCLVCTV